MGDGKQGKVVMAVASYGWSPINLALTSMPALAGDEDNDDEEDDEEQQSGQDVAQLLEEMHPALGDDHVYHVVAPDNIWI